LKKKFKKLIGLTASDGYGLASARALEERWGSYTTSKIVPFELRVSYKDPTVSPEITKNLVI